MDVDRIVNVEMVDGELGRALCPAGYIVSRVDPGILSYEYPQGDPR
jgi:hypothetical protein